MKYTPFVYFLFLSSMVIGQPLEDVIYKKDGSILRGTLVEHNYERGQFKIQLEGGSLFVVEKKDVIKITKEVPHNKPSTSIYQNAESRSEPPNHQALKIIEPSKQIKHSFFLSTLSHEVAIPDELLSEYYGGKIEFVQQYKGLRLDYQYVHSEHLASLYVIKSAKLNRLTFEDEDHNVLFEAVKSGSSRYLGISSLLVMSTNQQKGWRFFIGAGPFYNRYRDNQYQNQEDVYGALLDLGMGYSWYNWQLLVRLDGDITSNRPSEEDYSNFSLTAGYNF